MRQDLREQLGKTVTDAQFDATFPAWDELSVNAQHDKIESVRNDLLTPITKAGYEIRRKV